MATKEQTREQIDALFRQMAEMETRQKDAEEALNDLRISNAEKLSELNLELLKRREERELSIQQKAYERALKNGISLAAIKDREELDREINAIDRRLARELAAVDETDKKKRKSIIKALKAQAAADKKKLIDDDKEKRKVDEKYRKDAKKLDDAYRKEKGKKDAEALKSIASDLDISKISIGGGARARNKLAEQGITDEAEQNELIRAARGDGLQKALAGFAKQLEGVATSTAEAQSEIDTRLQGSKNDKSVLGSYWQKMSNNITGNLGMSPFLKQETAVKNLQTLVGKGIAFNVEQRAFLDTISEKIATTFESTDASLLKLVRIQQADSTAARLGMESALTAFLNNMYETTEYMTEAADSIRASIYEASALMDAEEATEFEYQVQK